MHQEAIDHPHHHGHDHDHEHRDHPHRPQVPSGMGRLFVVTLSIILLGLCLYSVCIFVDQTEYVYVTEFGKPVRLHVEPGLKFKTPYQSVRRLDRRMQMASPPGSQMLTRDRPRPADDRGAASADRHGASLGGPPLSVDWYVCWRLPTRKFAEERSEDFEKSVLRFVQSVGTITGAHDRLRERIDSMLKAKVGQMNLTEFVSLNANDIKLEQVNRELTDQIRQDAIEQFGIEVVDVRIKRFNHPEGVKPAIFDMIRAERQGVAERYRAEGKSEAAKIRSLADTERAQILSKAQADAERIRGEGDADAMRIAAEAHGQDPQFYQLLKTLDTYRAILNERTTIVLSSDSPLLKLLNEGMPKLVNPPKSRPTEQTTDAKPTSASGSGVENGEPEASP